MKLEKEKKEKSDLLLEMEKMAKFKAEFEDEVFEKVSLKIPFLFFIYFF